MAMKSRIPWITAVVADGPTAEVVMASPAYAPQVAKVLAPGPWLTVTQVAGALAELQEAG